MQSVRVVISSDTLVTLTHCIIESNLMVFNDSLIGVPEQGIRFAVVKSWILLWGRPIRHNLRNLVIGVRYYILR
jgi:hypothetical protein